MGSVRSRKIWKRSLLGLVSVIAVLALVVGLVLNVIFTPAKLTPLITRIANEQLNATVDCEKVELTFFRSFPRLGLRLSNTYVYSNNDSLSKDTLLAIDNASISFNLYEYFAHRNIEIRRLKLDHPSLHIQLNEDGTTNWDILKPEEVTDTISTETDSVYFRDLLVNRLVLNDAQLVFDDVMADLHYRVDSFSTKLNLTKQGYLFAGALTAECKNIQTRMGDHMLPELKRMTAELSIDFDPEKAEMNLDAKRLTINGIFFSGKGKLVPHPAERYADVSFHAVLATRSMEHFLSLAPDHLIPKKDILVGGKVALAFDVTGKYGSGNLPEIAVKMKVADGSLAYKNYPGKLDTIQAELNGEIYLDRSQPSFLKLEKLRVSGTGVKLNLDAKANDILNNAQIETHILSDIDLTTLYENFPVDSTISLHGRANADLNVKFTADNILQQAFDKLQVYGHASLNEVNIRSSLDSLQFSSDSMAVKFFRKTQQEQKSRIDLQITNTDLQYKNTMKANVQFIHINALLQRHSPNGQLVALEANIENVRGGMEADSLSVLIRKSGLQANLFWDREKNQPYILSDFTIDSLGVAYAGNAMGVRHGSYHVRLERLEPRKWLPQGTVSFSRLGAFSPVLKYPVFVPSTELSFDKDNFSLDNARISYGDSQVTLTGKINHATGFFTGQLVTAKLDLQSEFINANELLATFAGLDKQDEQQTAPAELPDSIQTADMEEKFAFRIPDSLRFDFTTRIQKIKFGASDLDEVTAILKLQDGNLSLTDFRLKTLAANFNGDLTYSAQDDESAALDFNFALSEIELSRLNEFLPPLDTLFPVTKSFVGTGDFRMKGTAHLDKNLNFDMATLKAVAAVKAREIMVLDGETFRELAKTFMFKNKDLNPVEKLDAEMEFNQGEINILPAFLKIDRYELAVGGRQRWDMSYDYHISVLKSPVPFKAGVDIDGKYTDYSYHVTKAKYKYYFTDKARLQAKADTSIIARKDRILDELNFKNE